MSAEALRALRAAQRAINSMKDEAETAAQGDEQMMLEACETISARGLEADTAIRAVIASLPSERPEAEDAKDRQIAALRDALLQCFDYPADVFELESTDSFTMTVRGFHLHLVKAALAASQGAQE